MCARFPAGTHSSVYAWSCSGSPLYLKHFTALEPRSIWNFLLMFTALWESFGGDSAIIRQHLNLTWPQCHIDCSFKTSIPKMRQIHFWVVHHSGTFEYDIVCRNKFVLLSCFQTRLFAMLFFLIMDNVILIGWSNPVDLWPEHVEGKASLKDRSSMIKITISPSGCCPNQTPKTRLCEKSSTAEQLNRFIGG